MPLDQLIQKVFAPLCLVYGLSHMLRPRHWTDTFLALQRTGAAAFFIGMFTLPTGVFLIVGHNKWVWDWPVFITLAGWGMTTKSIVYLLWPQSLDRLLARAHRGTLGFRLVGVVMVLFGGILSWQAYQS